MTKTEKKGLRRFIRGAVACALTVSVLSACGRSAVVTDAQVQSKLAERGDEVVVMSFNMKQWENYVGRWLGTDIRTKQMAEFIAETLPDSLGSQEMNEIGDSQMADYLPCYDSYGVPRGGDKSDELSERSTIFWLRDKYDCIDKDTFWLSETPDVESRLEGANCNWLCTWVLLENKESGARYLHMNTHLDYGVEEARVFGAEVILQKLGELEEKYPGVPVVLTGDFNETAAGPAYAVLVQRGFSDLFETAQTGENVRTFHSWGTKDKAAGQAIDFVFAKNVASASVCRVMTEMRTSISDHYPVMAVIDLGA